LTKYSYVDVLQPVYSCVDLMAAVSPTKGCLHLQMYTSKSNRAIHTSQICAHLQEASSPV